VQGRIRVDHPHHRDVRKIEPLGDHLGADQDVDLPPPHPLENPVMAHLEVVVSRSIRAMRAAGTAWREPLQLLVPSPRFRTVSAPHLGHAAGTGSVWSQ